MGKKRNAGFTLRIDDKYHRSVITYDKEEGLDKNQLSYKLLTRRSDGTGVSYTIVLPEEEEDEVIDLFADVEQYAMEYGSEMPVGSARSPRAGVIVGSPMDIGSYFISDDKSYEMAYRVEDHILGKHPELKPFLGISKEYVDRKEQEEAEAKKAAFDSLSINTLKEKYPVLFDENGEFKKEAIQFIISLIDNFGSVELTREDGKVERVARLPKGL